VPALLGIDPHVDLLALEFPLAIELSAKR